MTTKGPAAPLAPTPQSSRSSTGSPRDHVAHSLDCDALVAHYATNLDKGLTTAEATARLAKDGKNELPPPPAPSAWKRILAQFANPIVLTLLVAAIIALVEGMSRSNEPALSRFGDAIAIFLIVGLNAVLGFYQERQAEAALEALQKMQTPNARVRRDDKVAIVPAAELVAGDLLELEAGDAIPADARVVQSIDMAAEESALTGESVPVGKDAAAFVPEDAPLGDRTTMLFVGTNVQVYPGMIVGIHARDNDLVVNPNKTKKLTNIRSAGADEKLILAPPRQVTLEYALEFINDDELVEVTPNNIRLRKAILDHNLRKRAEKAAEAGEPDDD